jgi:Type II secretion system (T2SS), protein M subtype b
MIRQFIQRLNQRERILALLVGGVVIALINLFLWSWLLDGIHDSRRAAATRKLARNEQVVYMREGDLWAKREKWLREHQPAYHGASDASALLDQLKQIASKYNILIENPAIGNGETNATYQSVFASIETKSPWPELVHFLYDVQSPESFIVFESVNVMIDPADPTQMRGKFKIARWYAPANAGKLK